MSLINDALKRAAQKPASPPGASEVVAALRPAEERRHGFPVFALLIALIPLIALGAWFLATGLQMDVRPKPARIETIAARAPDPVAPAPILIVQPTNPPTTIPTPAPKPVYKLQAIFWRPSKPSAVVNGKTVYVGDRVETARVTAIDQESVTLAVNGESKVLLLP